MSSNVETVHFEENTLRKLPSTRVQIQQLKERSSNGNLRKFEGFE